MKDSEFKKIIGAVLRQKSIISSLLDRFHPSDIEQGFLLVSQEILNHDLKMIIMEKTNSLVNDYQVIFDQNCIYLDIDAEAKQLGRVSAKLMLTVKSFTFRKGTHHIVFRYQEDVKSEGNFMQALALKAAGLKGNYLETAAELAKLDFVKADKDEITIVLDQIDVIKKIPSSFTLNYISCENGILKLKFGLDE